MTGAPPVANLNPLNDGKETFLYRRFWRTPFDGYAETVWEPRFLPR